jgi:GntR family transcriptional repressor for pyruvate dehydrogenase complex
MTQDLDIHTEDEVVLTAALLRDASAVSGNAVFQVVSEELKQRIRRGEWLPGERLPSITQLAKALKVSTASMREALRSLQSIGLVKIEHGRGVFVTGSRSSSDVASHFQNVGIGLIVALAETRRILEPELAALAAERGADDELAEIERLAQQMEAEAKQDADFVEPDVQFHRRIAQAARNQVLYRMMESVNDLFLESRKVTSVEPGMTARAVRYHLLIAEALRDRNAPQARLLMLAHMNDTLSSLLAAEARAQQTEPSVKWTIDDRRWLPVRIVHRPSSIVKMEQPSPCRSPTSSRTPSGSATATSLWSKSRPTRASMAWANPA